MFGFATDETPDLMPAPIRYAHQLAYRLHEARTQNIIPYLRPDGKTQVSIEYNKQGIVRIGTVVLSTQHDPDIAYEQLREEVIRHIIRPIL